MKYKVLWICNTLLNEAAEQLGTDADVAGGWVEGLIMDFAKDDRFDLFMCCPVSHANMKKRVKCKHYNAITFITAEDNTRLFADVIRENKPDIIHVWGTEFQHSCDMIAAAKECNVLDKTVVSIQGLVSVIAKHMYSGLSFSVKYGFTIRDLLRRSNIFLSQKDFVRRGKKEEFILKTVRNVIGRTEWDHACVMAINPQIRYFKCNETLRSEFYSGIWTYKECLPHSIFVSQCHSSFKGFHFLVESLPEIIKKYPDTHVYTTGRDLFSYRGFNRQRLSFYHLSIVRSLEKQGLKEHVTFLGKLDAEQMKDRFLKSNVYLSPSSIENSPNSLGEAMLLGLPVISSDVGGVKDMLIHEKEGYIYQSDAPYMIPYYIDKVFSDQKKATEMGCLAAEHARRTHDKKHNLEDTIDIYKSIINNI